MTQPHFSFGSEGDSRQRVFGCWSAWRARAGGTRPATMFCRFVPGEAGLTQRLSSQVASEGTLETEKEKGIFLGTEVERSRLEKSLANSLRISLDLSRASKDASGPRVLGRLACFFFFSRGRILLGALKKPLEVSPQGTSQDGYVAVFRTLLIYGESRQELNVKTGHSLSL